MKPSLILMILLVPLVVTATPSDDVVAAMKQADQATMVLEINAGDAARASSELGAQGAAIARRCEAAVDQVIAAGATATSLLLVDGYKQVALGSVKPEHCAPLAELARTIDAKAATAKPQRAAKIRAPFAAAHVTGEKLEWAIRWRTNDYDFYGVGGAILSPAQLEAARVAFLITGDADHAWVLHRYVFLGDKLVGATQEEFLVRPGPSKFR